MESVLSGILPADTFQPRQLLTPQRRCLRSAPAQLPDWCKNIWLSTRLSAAEGWPSKASIWTTRPPASLLVQPCYVSALAVPHLRTFQKASCDFTFLSSSSLQCPLLLCPVSSHPGLYLNPRGASHSHGGPSARAPGSHLSHSFPNNPLCSLRVGTLVSLIPLASPGPASDGRSPVCAGKIYTRTLPPLL